jgi:hypothetical protein
MYFSIYAFILSQRYYLFEDRNLQSKLLYKISLKQDLKFNLCPDFEDLVRWYIEIFRDSLGVPIHQEI